MLDRPALITLCEAILKYSRRRIINQYVARKNHYNSFTNQNHKYELYNFRIEYRVSRDLLQDLKDVQEGIEVHHENIDKKIAAEQKRQRKAKRHADFIVKIEKMVLEHGYEQLEDIWKYRADKKLGDRRIQELEQKRNMFKPEQLILSF